MKKLLFIPLTLLFFSCDDSPTASINDKIPLNWAIKNNQCHFTDTNNMCEGYGGIHLDYAYQYETLELVDINSNGDYTIERCNRVMPPVLEESDFDFDNCTFDGLFGYSECITEACFEQDGFQNYWSINATCYQYQFNEDEVNDGCSSQTDYDFIKYK